MCDINEADERSLRPCSHYDRLYFLFNFLNVFGGALREPAALGGVYGPGERGGGNRCECVLTM